MPRARLGVAPRRRQAGDAIVTIALWRRARRRPAAAWCARALALGGLRRDDRSRARAAARATAVRDRIGELEATLATAARKKPTARPALPGARDRTAGRPSTRGSRDAARRVRRRPGRAAHRRGAVPRGARARHRRGRSDRRRDRAARSSFRRDLFWLLTALRPVRPGVDAARALARRARRGRRVDHARARRRRAPRLARAPSTCGARRAPGWHHAWGPPHDLRVGARARSPTRAAALRSCASRGAGADLLFGLEARPASLPRARRRAVPRVGRRARAERRAARRSSGRAAGSAAAARRRAARRCARSRSAATASIVVGDETSSCRGTSSPARLEEAAVVRAARQLALADGRRRSRRLWMWTVRLARGRGRRREDHVHRRRLPAARRRRGASGPRWSRRGYAADRSPARARSGCASA